MKENIRSIVVTYAADLKVGQTLAVPREKWPKSLRDKFEKRNFLHMVIQKIWETDNWREIAGYCKENPSHGTGFGCYETEEWLVIYESTIDWSDADDHVGFPDE